MIAGKDAVRPGEAKNSWLTGTAAWNYYAITRFILGIQPDYDGLTIDPCIPAAWEGFTIVRKFRGATYKITVSNPNQLQKGRIALEIDGEPLSGNQIPVLERDTIHEVTATIT